MEVSNQPITETVIQTEISQVDNSNPVEEKQIQNADIIRDPYVPVSEVCNTAETVAPVRMLYEMNKNIRDIDRKVRGIDDFVRKELDYPDMIDFCNAFNAEQVDAIAVAIWQIQNRKAVIIGDSTGIGKGRICAAILRYARLKGKRPIFITEKPNLFSDIYRDLKAIGSDNCIPLEFRGEEVEKSVQIDRSFIIAEIKRDIKDKTFDLDGFDADRIFQKGEKVYTEEAIEKYREEYFPDEVYKEFVYSKNRNYETDVIGKKRFIPFIVNGRSAKTDIKDLDGNIIYKGLSSNQHYDIIKSKELPSEYDCVLATYSQFSSGRLRQKIDFAEAIAEDNIVVMDESHNASGSSTRGEELTLIAEKTQSIIFASATYAKRPDNMTIYSVKTSIADAELSKDELIKAIQRGGIAMQEILSSQLVSEGQMIRRERGYAGIDINYITLDESCDITMPNFNLKNAHYAIVDRFVSVIRDIIDFVNRDINIIIEQMRVNHIEEECGAMIANLILNGNKAEVDSARESCEADLYNSSPYAGLFNILNQMYFALKAEAVAEWAIYRMKQGKKPVIALASTMESVLDYAIDEAKGTQIPIDFRLVLERRLAKAIEYTIINKDGEIEKKTLDKTQLKGEALYNYERLKDIIDNIITGLIISPIDLIRKRIEEAGFSVDEVTGRNRYVEIDKFEEYGYVKSRKIPNASDVFRKFNDNELDCIIINQAGATGASAHAIKTNNVVKVDYTNNGKVIVPTSLDDKTEVKQRVMIILQAEGDINKEVQKRGRIYRTGQIMFPIYDYIFSAIPSEKRLMMMLRKKLQSLDANTSSNKDQSSEILDVVDFLNPYGDEVVAQYLGENESVNAKIGTPITFSANDRDGVVVYSPNDNIDELAHKVTGRIALLNTDEQEVFYNEIIGTYNDYKSKLIQEGRWNLGVDSLDLQANTLEKHAITVGNTDKKSVFGGATFIELCEVNNVRKPFTQKYLSHLFEGMLSKKDSRGNIVELDSDQYVKELMEKIDERANSEYDLFKPNYEKSKLRELEGLHKQKSILKIKDESVRAEVLKEEEKRVSEIWDNRLSQLSSVFERAKKYKSIVEFFFPKKIISYNLQGYDYDGIVVGVKLVDGTFLTPNSLVLKIAFPSTLRHLDISFSNVSEIERIIKNTLNIYSDSQRLFLGKQLFQNWDERIKDFNSDRVNRYIVTGNILKAYGIPEISNSSNKLISYSTNDKKVKKGILLPEEFDINKLTIKVPMESAISIAVSSIGGSHKVLPFGETGDIYIIPRGDVLYLNRKKTRQRIYHIDKAQELLEYLSANWEVVGDAYRNQMTEKENIAKVVEYLYGRGLPMMMSFNDFQAIAKNYDTEDRFKGEKSIEDIINEHNELLERYEQEKEKEFKLITEGNLKKFSEMEKELYEMRKEKEKNKALRIMVDTIDFAQKFNFNQLTTMREGGSLSIAQIQEDSDYELISDETQIKEILCHYEPRFEDIDEITKEPYYIGIGGLFVNYKDGDIVSVFAFEGSPILEKPIFQIYPQGKYF